MNIISHRGYWREVDEKNQFVAFERSFTLGYGTETDIRDLGGKLVISHDMPRGDEITFEQMLEVADRAQRPLTLALNVKADGLASEVRAAISRYPQLDCFVFDMAVPDMRSYLNLGVPVFTRMSEVERQPVWLDQSEGVWLDGFDATWFGNDLIIELLDSGKRVCVVSSELHKRDHLPLWGQLKSIANLEGLILCTDLPEDATKYFF